MDYSRYTVEDFIEDPVFIKWVLNSNPDLNLFWENWLLDHPEKYEEVQKSRKIILAFQYKKYPRDENRKKMTWSSIERINEEYGSKLEEKLKNLPVHPTLDQKVPSIKKPSYKIIILKWAAVFAGILLISVLVINQMNYRPTQTREAISLIIKSNPKGQKSKIFLPDGSIVFLNAESSLCYWPGFTPDKREIRLSGEAFFEVAKDSLRPFVVIAENLVTTALGTSFNIKAYPEDQEVLISLLTGSVSVQRKDSVDHVLFLNPGEAAGLNHPKGILMPKEFNYEQEILWKDGILYFKEIPLEEAFKRLEIWYGVSFNLKNLPRRPIIVTGKFDNENLTNVLRSLSHTVSFDYTINNEEIIVSFK